MNTSEFIENQNAKQKQNEIKQEELLKQIQKLDNKKTDKKEIEKLQKELKEIKLSKARQKVLIASATYNVPKTPQNAPVQLSDAKMFIYDRESGNRTDAINSSSGACGLGQALPCSKMGCSLSDYDCQDKFFTSYMQNRYGTWENARQFWLENNYW